MARILIVDDDENMRQLLAMHLASAGHGVQVAEDAGVACHLLLAAHPELMIVDVNMPYMTGFEFVSAVKSDPSIGPIPTIFLTSEESGYDRARELGAYFLAKPVSSNRLLAMVNQILAEASPNAGA